MSDPKVETVTITKEEYKELINDQAFLYALQAAGVDSWEGIDEAKDIFNGDD